MNSPNTAGTTKTFSSALNRVLTELGYDKNERGRIKRFHEEIVKPEWNLSYESARKWISGESIPRTDKINRLAARLRCNAEYLLSFKEPMMIDDTPSEISESAAAEYVITTPWEKLLSAIQSGELTDLFTVEINYQSGPLSGYSKLTAAKNLPGTTPTTNLVIGLFQDELDLFYIKTDGPKTYYTFANPDVSHPNIHFDSVEPLAWIVDGIPKPLRTY